MVDWHCGDKESQALQLESVQKHVTGNMTSRVLLLWKPFCIMQVCFAFSLMGQLSPPPSLPAPHRE